MDLSKHKHAHRNAINGDWIDKDGVVHNLDGNVGHKPNNYNQMTIPGTYIDSNGVEQNIDTAAIFGSGGSGGGISLGQLNSAIAAEAAARSAADDTERLARIAGDAANDTEITKVKTDISNINITLAGNGTDITDLRGDLAQEISDRTAADAKEVIDRNAAIAAALGSGGGGGSGVTMGDVNTAIGVETGNRTTADSALDAKINKEIADRTAADTKEVTDRNNAISSAISALPPGLSMVTVNAAIDVEKNARIAADAAEVTARDGAITAAIGTEITNRDAAISTAIAGLTANKMAVQLAGSFLVKTINGTTTLARSLFPDIALMKPGKVVINDTAGTIGIYESDPDASNIIVRTIAFDTVGGAAVTDPVLLGDVATKADLDTSEANITTLFGRTPNVGDRIGVKTDESNGGAFTEYYILAKSGGVLTYGSPRTINTSQYQAQTPDTDAGKVPIAGSTAGTWGTPRSIDTIPTAGSHNLIESGAVALAITAASGKYYNTFISTPGDFTIDLQPMNMLPTDCVWQISYRTINSSDGTMDYDAVMLGYTIDGYKITFHMDPSITFGFNEGLEVNIMQNAA